MAQQNKGALKAFAVRIEERLVRTVVVYAESAEQAEDIAHDLCSDGVVNLDYDDFEVRECKVEREAGNFDLSMRERYNEGGEYSY